jgi:hypothetical protein
MNVSALPLASSRKGRIMTLYKFFYLPGGEVGRVVKDQQRPLHRDYMVEAYEDGRLDGKSPNGRKAFAKLGATRATRAQGAT